MKEPTSVIGLDPAFSATGVARWRDGRLSTMTICTDDRDTTEQRISTITSRLWPLLSSRTFVVLEAPYMMANGKTSMMLAGLHYIIRYGLWHRGVPFAVVTPAQLKVFAVGNGGATKEAMVTMAWAMYGGTGYVQETSHLAMGQWMPPVPENKDDKANSHEADALHCLTMGLHHAGVSAAPGGAMEPGIDSDQQTYLANLRVGWPELEWNE